ncbi:hypothetical protein H6G36_02870 [Anabaena minutissima FACHB-250]|nr:hypothetical protein [Anabaena minutissima FACHB-250]
MTDRRSETISTRGYANAYGGAEYRQGRGAAHRATNSHQSAYSNIVDHILWIIF